jgi:hypothetical protein
MTDPLTFNLRFATDHVGDGVVLQFGGDPNDLARPHIVDALHRLGRSEDGVTGFALSPSDVFDGTPDVIDSQFLLLQGDETLRALRGLIGPDDSTVLLRTTGWGGSDLPEMFHWVVNDLMPYGQTLLEIYGAVEVLKVVGRTTEARRNRTIRREAEYWVRSGREAPQGILLDAVLVYDHWEAGRVESTFGLGRSEAAKLMDGCGYDYEPASRMYLRLNAYEGLDLTD